MGGWTCLEYVLKDPRKVRALVLTSTCGSIDRASVPLADPNRLNEWDRMADAARADMARRGISPPAGERMAKEQPSLHYLYREIANASAAFDRAELRKRLFAIATRPADVLRGLSMPTLFITGGEDRNYPPFLSEALAPMMPNAKVEQVPETGHSVYFQRPEIYNRLVGDFLLAVGALGHRVPMRVNVRDGVIRVAPTGSKASPNARYAFNGDQICASQRTDANGMDRPCSRPEPLRGWPGA